MPETTAPAPALSLEEVNNGSPFLTAAGLQVTEATGQLVVGTIELGPEHHTPWGVVHGGVYTTAVESAASIGASAAVADRGQFAAGVYNSTDFIRSATGGTATVRAVPVQQGRTQQLWDVTITDAHGSLLARGSLRLHNLDLRR
ncbi:PaaI family thioesterase [Mycolicibacterium sp. lyk4-40-TYG-92]|uniref:PaaI family thioesterase n=1 Tax=Mycolicibacterium sp. lyk4-40-TYG-92 TaxID=3040295 RepID=UPI00254DDEDD|nr:PaaI family thioesterase [Mycolicibacterium sp. lyk4-40-TYG-92]